MRLAEVESLRGELARFVGDVFASVVADAGYGQSTPFRLALQERGLGQVVAVTGREVARAGEAVPHRPAYGGLGPPTPPRCRTTPIAVADLAAGGWPGRLHVGDLAGGQQRSDEL